MFLLSPMFELSMSQLSQKPYNISKSSTNAVMSCSLFFDRYWVAFSSQYRYRYGVAVQYHIDTGNTVFNLYLKVLTKILLIQIYICSNNTNNEVHWLASKLELVIHRHSCPISCVLVLYSSFDAATCLEISLNISSYSTSILLARDSHFFVFFHSWTAVFGSLHLHFTSHHKFGNYYLSQKNGTTKAPKTGLKTALFSACLLIFLYFHLLNKLTSVSLNSMFNNFLSSSNNFTKSPLVGFNFCENIIFIWVLPLVLWLMWNLIGWHPASRNIFCGCF